MRDAEQGFFDIAVNFEDIFCSAKFDTCYAATETSPERPIELLFGYPTAGGSLERGHTGVLALACTGGPNAGDDTHLYLNPIKITCPGANGATTITLDPSAGPGNVYPTPGTFDSGSVWQYAVYEGQEQLNCDGLSCDKAYWNVAIGLEGLPAGCTLATEATATAGALAYGQLEANASYPIIKFNDIVLTGDQGVLCSQNPLGSPGVDTEYKDIGDTASFGNELTQGTGLTVDTHTVTLPDDPNSTIAGAQGVGEIGKGQRKLLPGSLGGPADQQTWVYFNLLDSAPWGVNVTCNGNAAASWELYGPGTLAPNTSGAMLLSGNCNGATVGFNPLIPWSVGIYFIHLNANGTAAAPTQLIIQGN
ncbi:MAG: hypothetical protein JNJ59_01230 [Deltaproteobacteria bacterium]|nr:hypothetical protein [Deltaproteobacteria bacterium]